MSASVIKEADWSSVVKGDYGLWVAGYPDNRDSWDIPKFLWNVSPWPFYAIWQYTSSGGRLDRDVFTGDRTAWDKYAARNGSAPAPSPSPTPAPATKSIEDLATEVIRGDWGNGQDRKNRLTAAGYDYGAIQSIVNQRLAGSSSLGSSGQIWYTVKSGDTLATALHIKRLRGCRAFLIPTRSIRARE